jgi:hypothetical protein
MVYDVETNQIAAFDCASLFIKTVNIEGVNELDLSEVAANGKWKHCYQRI